MFEKIGLDIIDRQVGAQSVPAKDIATRQAFGAYYTPLQVASILADWAIRNAEERILEPCFGGCDFLEAVQIRFLECGQSQFTSHMFGCDIDPDAFGHLSNRMSAKSGMNNFLHADFLTVTPEHFGKDAFDAVLGNPPYIKNDRISSSQKVSVNQLPQQIHKCVKGRANLWAYFVMHAMSFLKTGGRMAWVLPGNFLSADYSFTLREELAKRFKQVTAISVAERLFLAQGTEERTVILLCDGYQQGDGKEVQIKYCSSSLELRSLLMGDGTKDDNALSENGSYTLLTKDQSQAFMDLARISQARRVAEFGTVYIGIVIGDKKFFIRRMSDWKKTAISESYLVPVVSRFKYLSGLSTKSGDISAWENDDQEVFLLNTRGKKLGCQVNNYLDSNEKNNNGDNSTFLRREIWHQPDDGRIADAFVACLNNFGPRMVLNSQKLQATNSLYRFNFTPALRKAKQKMFAISLLTSFSQLSAEINGRQLGSGGLKLEPKGVSNILLSMNDAKTEAEISVAFNEVDTLIRYEKFDDARLVADRFIFGDLLPKASYESICAGLLRVRGHRLRSK